MYIETQKLDAIKFAISRVISKKQLDGLLSDCKIDLIELEAGDMLITLSKHVHARNKEYLRVDRSWPKTWWDAFKLRWFPKWAINRWPSAFDSIHIDQKIYGDVYTNIDVPNRHKDIYIHHNRFSVDLNTNHIQ